MQNELPEWEKLRKRLGGIEAAPFRGDNLAIFLAGEFDPGIESEELDDSGTWKQGAIDAANAVLDAIHAHYLQALVAARREGIEMAATVLTAQGSALWEKADLRQPTERDDAFAAFIVDNCAAAIRQLGDKI